MDLRDLILKGLKKTYRTIVKPQFENLPCELDRQRTNDIMYELLSCDRPCMISRFGTTEIGIVTNYLTVHNRKASMFKRCLNYITDNTGLPWWDKIIYKSMHQCSGIFPVNLETLEKFSQRYLQDIPEIDLLGSFNYTERFMPLREDVIFVHLECLYPFFVEHPWTKVLKGKKVLVIHPFVETIKRQHKLHEKLFINPQVYPDYQLIPLKAVQSLAGSDVPFADWFEALKYMEDKISQIDFDFAIIGCGAYGLPLAAHVKRIGKKAIHLGGGSQLLFGIKGKRWDNDAYHWTKLPNLNTSYSNLYNEFWTRPDESEKPKSAFKVEGACYW